MSANRRKASDPDAFPFHLGTRHPPNRTRRNETSWSTHGCWVGGTGEPTEGPPGAAREPRGAAGRRQRAGGCRHFRSEWKSRLRFDTQASANGRELFTCHPLLDQSKSSSQPRALPQPMGSQPRHSVNDAAVQGRLSHVSWKAASMETRREQGKQLPNAKMMTFNP